MEKTLKEQAADVAERIVSDIDITFREDREWAILIAKQDTRINELEEYLKEAQERVLELEAWYNGTWMKGVPDINTTVLIEHELGANGTHDVACYQGKDNKGDDKFMMPNGTEIFRKHVIRWRMI